MRIELARGDITEFPADAIVNAANEQLVLGSGVAGAIRSRGGPKIQTECDRLAPVESGDAVATTAGALPYRCIIHAVAPRVSMPDWETRLARAVRSVIRVAEAQELRHVALPALGTGVFGLPLLRAARIMLTAALEAPPTHSLERLTFCLYDENAYQTFARTLGEARARARQTSPAPPPAQEAAEPGPELPGEAGEPNGEG
jgi:O-acetyl-ADP-ribose deacetylase